MSVLNLNARFFSPRPNFGLGVLSSSCMSVRPSVRYHYDISETKSCRATNFGYVMCLVNCGKPIEIGHARHRIYGVSPFFNFFLYYDISETKSRLATKCIYIMYLVNSGKPIEIRHARQMIYGVMPLFQVSVVSVCLSLSVTTISPKRNHVGPPTLDLLCI